MDWDDLRIVLAIRDAGGLAGAARNLGVNHSTVFRRLNAFEERLGVRLFERLAQGYTPTAAGNEMAATAARIAEQVDTLDRRISGRDVRLTGTLAVTTTDTLATHVMGPIFAGFRNAYPGIHLEVLIAGNFFNLSKRQADVAVRPTLEPPESLFGRRVCGLGFAVYGSEGTPKPKGGWATETWVGPDDSLGHLNSAKWLARTVSAEHVVFRSNSLAAMAAAAAAGIGLAALPCFIGDSDPRLVRLAGPLAELGSALWLLTHEDLRGTARVRAFMEYAGERLIQEKVVLEGSA